MAVLSRLLMTILAAQTVRASLTVDVNDANSIKSTAAIIAYDMMTYYNGNQSGQIPGKIPGTWWEGGAMFMTLIQYWHWTGDDSYNDVTTQGMLWQAGEHDDYMPSNWSNYLGNDDQVFWGLAAMTAAELKFPDAPNQPSWLELAQGVFNTQQARWDTTNCNGGLRWQIWPYQAGYTTKNAISNGGFFQLSARLARYTSNQTYADWAEKAWDWSATTPLLNTTLWYIADTTSIAAQCHDHGDFQWTYNYGSYLMGAVYMYNMTGNSKWKDGIDGLLKSSFQTFFPNGTNIMCEVSCETIKTCDRNQVCFKTFLSTWMAFTTVLAPYTTDEIKPKLQASMKGAAQQCSGGSDGQHCGLQWYSSTWDGVSGLEVQMSALGIFSANLVFFDTANSSNPVTANTGGTSKSDPSAGLSEPAVNVPPGVQTPITTGDRAGAGILTVIFVTGWLGMMSWMLRGG